MDDLNRIFKVELRPLFVRIEHVDLSSYLNRTISHDKTTRHPRKPKKEEFIGLDEEDVVELQQNNTSISSVGKRKSILVTDRIESPNSAKKKVKFSDSPSIKYVEKVNFSDDDDDDSEDQKDADYEGSKPSKKKSPKVQNGGATPENGKPRRGRPKKVKDVTEEEEKKDEDGVPTKEGSVDSSEKKEDVTVTGSTNAEVVQNDEKDDEPSTSDGEKSEEQPEKGKVISVRNFENCYCLQLFFLLFLVGRIRAREWQCKRSGEARFIRNVAICRSCHKLAGRRFIRSRAGRRSNGHD